MERSLKVAVIGAGMAGLLAARELRREGHRIVVFEKGDRLGGMWVYDPRSESDPLSLDPNRDIIHGSLYFSLRTNLPRQLMAFSDYPFVAKEGGDPRNFPSHEEVLRFLEDFAGDFGIAEWIRFGSEVVRVERVDSGEERRRWVVESRTGGGEANVEEVFEAVVVCSGHHTEPTVAQIPGIEKWRGKQVHSHNYRHPRPFQDQIVVMIGNGPSAFDISREVATVAKEVHLSSRSPDIKISKLDNYHNIWQHSKIADVHEDGKVVFQDGSSVYADTIFHCTGYKYSFPFLKTNGIVSVEDNRVGPLYKHVFPPKLAPWLSFVGITRRGLSFRVAESQSRWIARALSEKLLLPSEEEMLADVEEHYRKMEERGTPKHDTHLFSISDFGLEYLDWLAPQVQLPPVDEGVKEIFGQFFKHVFIMRKDSFRDESYTETSAHNVT